MTKKEYVSIVKELLNANDKVKALNIQFSVEDNPEIKTAALVTVVGNHKFVLDIEPFYQSRCSYLHPAQCIVDALPDILKYGKKDEETEMPEKHDCPPSNDSVNLRSPSPDVDDRGLPYDELDDLLDMILSMCKEKPEEKPVSKTARDLSLDDLDDSVASCSHNVSKEGNAESGCKSDKTDDLIKNLAAFLAAHKDELIQILS